MSANEPGQMPNETKVQDEEESIHSTDDSEDEDCGCSVTDQKDMMISELNQILQDAQALQVRLKDSTEESQKREEQIHLEKSKIVFQNYVQDKLDKISIRLNIIRFKYASYKKCFDVISILIIVVSATLTFVESIKAEFELEDTNVSSINTFFTIFPIAASSAITVTAAVMKFKKYQEKMEALSRCTEKAIFTTYRLKRIQEQTIHAKTLDEVHGLIKTYSGEPYDLYLKCQEEIEKCLKYEDLVKHMKTYFDLSLDYQQEEANYQLSRMGIGLHQSRLKKDLQKNISKNIWVKTWGDVVNSICTILCCCRNRKNRRVLRSMISHYRGSPAQDPDTASSPIEVKVETPSDS